MQQEETAEMPENVELRPWFSYGSTWAIALTMLLCCAAMVMIMMDRARSVRTAKIEAAADFAARCAAVGPRR